MTRDEIKQMLQKHQDWWNGKKGGCRADLSGADLSRADLSRADLRDADLSRAVLRDADLSRAVLSGADLSRADLRDADLSRAVLSGADLRDADLRDAVLSGTCLAPSPSPFDWAEQSGCDLRTVQGRTLVLASRTRLQIHMGGTAYKVGQTYRAPVFSRNPCTYCHPGLYIAGGPDCDIAGWERILVACWLDEMIIIEKCRVPRFRTLLIREEFDALTAEDLD